MLGLAFDEIYRLSEKYLSLVDGVLFAGGEDVHPKFQDEDPTPALGDVNPLRDEYEIVCAKLAFNKQKKPILGICRGIQVLAIAFGGKVHQDIASTASVQHSQHSPRWACSHNIHIEPESMLAKIAGGDKEIVNSFHHQAVKTVPIDFFPTAKTSDGIIEAIESKDPKRFCLGVQWHPEETFETDEFSRGIFKAFIDACKK